MRRTPMFLVAGAAGLTTVVVLHPARSAVAGLGHNQAATTPTAGGSSVTTAPARAHPAPTQPAGPSRTTQPAGPSRTTQPAGTSGTRSAAGPAVNFGYGTISVRVTADGRRIVGVSVPLLNTLDSTSQSIAQQAIPMLRQQVISAQSANIQGVSGATYVSVGYYRSLQAAISKLGL